MTRKKVTSVVQSGVLVFLRYLDAPCMAALVWNRSYKRFIVDTYFQASKLLFQSDPGHEQGNLSYSRFEAHSTYVEFSFKDAVLLALYNGADVTIS